MKYKIETCSLVVKRRERNKKDSYKDDQLLELVGDLCNFILDQIVHVKGTYHDRDSDLVEILSTNTFVRLKS